MNPKRVQVSVIFKNCKNNSQSYYNFMHFDKVPLNLKFNYIELF